MRFRSPARGRRSAAARAASLLSAAAVALMGLTLPAHAADNPHIQFSDPSLVKIDNAGDPVGDGSRLTLDSGQDRVKFSVDWSLPNGNTIEVGDSFTVTLPSELNSAQTTAGGLGRPELKIPSTPGGPADTKVGSCEIFQTRFVCTFDEKAKQLVDGGFQNFGGNVGLQLVAKATTDQEQLPFTFSGATGEVQVDLPGTGGIGAAKPRNPYKFIPAHFAKGSTAIGSASNDISFVLGISTSVATSRSFAFLTRQAGNELTFDGREQTLEFTDVIGSGLKFDDPANWAFSFTDSAETPDADAPDVLLAKGDGVPKVTEKGTWTLSVVPGEVTPDGQTAKVSITGPFAADTNYLLAYKGLPQAGGKLKPGFKYENTFSYDNADVEAKYSRSFGATFTSETRMDPNYGSFAITKFVGGPGSSLIAQGTEFTVKATYVLPNQLTADAFPGWDAPGTINPDRTGGEVTMTAKVGEKITFVGAKPSTTFPAGTVVTFSELENPAAAPAGYAWASHTFTSKDQPAQQVTIVSQQVFPVDLTNVLRKQPTGKFSVSKTVDGLAGGVAAPAEYTFRYVCNDPAASQGELRVASDGTPKESPGLPAGAECTITEDLVGTEIAGYRLTPTPEQRVTIEADQVLPVQASNVYTPTMGKFTVTKRVVNNDDAAVPADFSFTVTCGAEAPETFSLADGAVWTSKDLAEGTECTVVEDVEAAKVFGFTLVSDVAGAPVQIVAGQTAAVTVTNTYTKDPVGTFQVKKTATGAPDLAVKDFVFDYSCVILGQPVAGKVTAKGDEVPVRVNEKFPVGTVCTVTEDAASAAVAGYTLQASDPQTVTIEAEPTVVEAAFTNTYTQQVGTFQVKKTATGAPDLAVKDFVFDYSCQVAGAPVEGKVTAKGDEVAVRADRSFPVGTVCTVTEDAASAAVAGYTLQASDPQTVTIEAEPAVVEAQFTNTYTTAVVSVGDFVWFDANRNGLQDDGEEPVAEVKVVLKNADGTVVAETKTDATGHYGFKDLTPGAEYILEFTKPDNTAWTTQDAPGDDAKDSDVDANGTVRFTAPAAGQNLVGPNAADEPRLDAGLVRLVSIGDFVWFDANRDGKQDDDEKPVKDVKVTLVDAEGRTVGVVSTDAGGYYGFQNLVAGAEYKLIFEGPDGHVWTVKDADANGADDKDSDVTQDPVQANLGTIEFTAPAKGGNQAGAGAADDPSLDGGLVEAPKPPVDPVPPVPSPSPSASPAPSAPAPSVSPSPAPSAPAPSVSPTPVPSASPSPSVAPVDPVKPIKPPVKPVKPVKPPVKPGLPKTGR